MHGKKHRRQQNRYRVSLLGAFAFFLLLIACVPKAKYQTLLLEKERLLEEQARQQRQAQALLGEQQAFQNQLQDLENQAKKAKADLQVLEKQLDSLSRERRLEQARLAQAHKETTELRALQQTHLKRLEEVQNENERLKKQLSQSQVQQLSKKETEIRALLKALEGALKKFEKQNLSFSVQENKIHIFLPDKALFALASIEIEREGVVILNEIAKILSEKKQLFIRIEGHTDDIPVTNKTLPFSDNWDLSVLRATAVTRLLIAQGVSPQQVLPSGRGQQKPLVENDSPENRQKNRRIEIILSTESF
jgi:chemotaxis protein MotB